MKTWLVKDARARFGDVMTGALAGEPQRVTRRGREAVVVVSQADWDRVRPAQTRKTPSQVLAENPLTPEEWREILPERRPHRPSVTFDD